MTGKQEKELRERQPSWPAWLSWALSIAGTIILAFAALTGGAAVLLWKFESECPKATVDCVYVVRRPGLLFLGVFALVSAAIALWTMIRATRSREVRQLRTAVALLAVTFSLILAVWGTLLIDNSSYKRHEYRPSSDDPCEVYDCNPSSATPPTEGGSK